MTAVLCAVGIVLACVAGARIIKIGFKAINWIFNWIESLFR